MRGVLEASAAASALAALALRAPRGEGPRPRAGGEPLGLREGAAMLFGASGAELEALADGLVRDDADVLGVFPIASP